MSKFEDVDKSISVYNAMATAGQLTSDASFLFSCELRQTEASSDKRLAYKKHACIAACKPAYKSGGVV